MGTEPLFLLDRMTFVHPTRIAGAPRNFIPVRPATLADSLPVGAGQEVGSVAQEAVVAVLVVPADNLYDFVKILRRKDFSTRIFPPFLIHSASQLTA